jgi:AraC-like DNA-binding protein
MHLPTTALADRPPIGREAARCGPLIVTTASGWTAAGQGLAATDRPIVVALDGISVGTPPPLDRMSLRTTRRGAELLTLSTRKLVVDEDAYILLDGRPDRSSRYVGDAGVSPLSVTFATGSLEQALAAPDADGTEAPASRRHEWLENLHPLGETVNHHLQRIERHARAGTDDPMWWEERIALLLGAALEAERTLQAREALMAALKPSTRRELLRRVLMASDFIQSAYDQPIDLGDIAMAAHLSRFHLVRLFRAAHDVTPHAYLLRKRLQVALRLLARTRLGLDDIAARTGLGTRSSLFRHVRRMQGHGAAALRASWPTQGA